MSYQRKKSTHTPIRKIVFWAIGIIILIGAIFGIRAISQNGQTKTVLDTEISEPSPALFSDSNDVLISARDNIPTINDNRTLRHSGDLEIYFRVENGEYRPAMKMNLSGEELAQHIKITPFIRGTWQNRGANILVFSPESEWPANKKFTVKMASSIFNDDVKIKNQTVKFKTPEITDTVISFTSYPAPDVKNSVLGVAVISFNYPIENTDLEKHISLKLDGAPIDFTVKLDRFSRTAIIKSAPISVSNAPQVLKLKIGKISAASGTDETKILTANTTIESADNIFKISDLRSIVADSPDGNTDQLIIVNTTAAADSRIKTAVHAYILPRYKTTDERDSDTPHNWSDDEITDEILHNATALKLSPVDFAAPAGTYQYAFSYNVSDNKSNYIYVVVDDGISSVGGFKMKNGTGRVLQVAYPERSVKIAGTGALLSLSGERKLGIVARGGIDSAYVNLYKVKSSEINHLISQIYNVFAPNINFKSWAFGVYDMSVVFQKHISFANPSMKNPSYASVDLGNYLDRTGTDKTGIFIVQTGTSESDAEYNDKRLILLTDMGIIRKVNLDESSSVFISHLSSGTPASDVEISVLGRNGNAVWSGRTDDSGRADIPKLAWNEYRNAREPVAIVVRNGNDVSFIPYSAYDIRTDFSKFDTDGVYAYHTNPVNAYLFSDRGIYRAGESVVIGGIVKTRDFKSTAGVPVKIEMADARGRIVLEKIFSLNADGIFDVKYDLPQNAPLGNYDIRLYTVNAKNKPQDTIGMASIRVEEFVADTMKISATLDDTNDNGWISPDALRANISLRNLFGTPAANRQVKISATLKPQNYTFKKYSEYAFTTNNLSGSDLASGAISAAQTLHTEISDIRTNDDGKAVAEIKFDQPIAYGTYVLNLNIRGFDADGGNSVATNISTRVSDMKNIVGWHSDSNLKYISRASNHTVKFIALGADGTSVNLDNLKMRLSHRENLVSLIKDANNYYKYQSVVRDSVVRENDFNISANGTEITLDTSSNGTFFVQILDDADNILANVEYFVASDKNATLTTDKNAEMQIKLNSSEYSAGDTIAVNITAPYSGTGLITIERDRVYAYKWFHTDSATSTQYITIPSGFEGTGYVNVSFVRDINSRDIFTTPYAYAAAPFMTDTARRQMSVELSVPDVIRNNKLTVKYKTNKSGKMMLFAVNTGILQVAKYQIPNPIKFFFQKSALQVETFQTLSLLLPEYKILAQYGKTGGGDYYGDTDAGGAIINPFARRTLTPVAFYSGLLDISANESGKYSFDIPEYFNGEVSVYAVTSGTDTVGSASTKTLVQSPIVITPTAPLMAAPNDEFQITASITNLSDTDAHTVRVSVKTSDNIELLGDSNAVIDVANRQEGVFNVRARAGDNLGNGEIIIDAQLVDSNNKTVATRTSTSTISVRPATVFETYIKSGVINSDTTTVKSSAPQIYAQNAMRTLYISSNATAIIRPLVKYLEKYEFDCTEQLVSKTIPYVMAGDDALLGTSFEKSEKFVSDAINKLKARQNDNGSFELFSSGATHNDTNNAQTLYLTAYVVQFLTLAQENGYTVPENMLNRALGYLRDMAGGNITDAEHANAVAYAIFVITQNGYVSTSYINLFEEYADKNIPDWKHQIMGAYIGGAYKILKKDDAAQKLISEYKMSTNPRFEYISMFRNNVADDAMYYYIARKYGTSAPTKLSDTLTAYLNSGDYTSFTSAAIVMAMSGTDQDINTAIDGITITADNANIAYDKSESGLVANIPLNAKSVKIACPQCDKDNAPYYTMLTQGYPTKSERASNGIEILRQYYDMSGNQISRADIGDMVRVKIMARTHGATDIAQNVAIVDLLPSGFVPDAQTITGTYTYAGAYEDRVVIYTDLTRDGQLFEYTAQLTGSGQMQTPPIYAESMYDAQINATGTSGTFTVLNDGATQE